VRLRVIILPPCSWRPKSPNPEAGYRGKFRLAWSASPLTGGPEADAVAAKGQRVRSIAVRTLIVGRIRSFLAELRTRPRDSTGQPIHDPVGSSVLV
jgi:hypothetical protein